MPIHEVRSTIEISATPVAQIINMTTLVLSGVQGMTSTILFIYRILNTKTPYIYSPDCKRDEKLVSVFGHTGADSLFRTLLPKPEYIGLSGCPPG
jgi:hypothetical protein